MKLVAKLALVFLTISSISAVAEIEEIGSMNEAFKPLKYGTLLVLDIDNTILAPTQTLGSDQWYGAMVSQSKNKGNSEAQAIAEVIPVWMKAQTSTQVLPIEKTTPRLIREIQKKGILVMALTARPTELSDVTLRQLKSIGIAFPTTESFTYSHPGDADHTSVGFHNGVLFVGPKNNKGVILSNFMVQAKLEPKQLVFVDDKVKHVTNMEEVFSKTMIPNINYRYGAADKKVQKYSQEIADTELALFEDQGILLSDEDSQAMDLKARKPQGQPATQSKRSVHPKKK